ncbi:hypothetical protein K502DRAFT_323494 [Neoconidiobolus thromboides FSU 785]|nr:hypothetical protein K502DRAFT_323494 [Neoconidiobolus thromboides FSU 785]
MSSEDLLGYAFAILISISAVFSIIINVLILSLSISDIRINSRLATFLLIQLCFVLLFYDVSTLTLNLKWVSTMDNRIPPSLCQAMGFLLNLAVTLFPGAVIFRYAYFYETVVLDRKPNVKNWSIVIFLHFTIICLISTIQSAMNQFQLRDSKLQCTTSYNSKEVISILSTILLIVSQLAAGILHIYITVSTYFKMARFDKKENLPFYSPMLYNLKVLRSEASIEPVEPNDMDPHINEKRYTTVPTAPITPKDVLIKYIPVTIVYFLTGLFFISLPIYELTTSQVSPIQFQYAYAILYSIAKFYVLITIILKNPSILRGFEVGFIYTGNAIRKLLSKTS